MTTTTRRLFVSAGLGMVALLSGCLSATQLVHFPDQSKSIETPGKARVYMMFPYMTNMTTFRVNVYENDRAIGANSANGYLCWETDPGEKRFSSKVAQAFGAKAALTVSLQPNRVYYIKQDLRPMGLVNTFSMQLLSDMEGRKVLAGCTSPE